MKYIVPNYKLGIVNKFADYLLSEIDKNNDTYTSIQVVMFKEFFVIDGFTSSKERIDLNYLKEKFQSKNKSLFDRLHIESFNTIDLIKYDAPIPQFSMWFDYHSSSRPLFHEKVLEYVHNYPSIEWDFIDYTNEIILGIDHLFEKPNYDYYVSNYGVVKSDFPHGFSYLYGRSAFYYFEYIANQIMSVAMTDKVEIRYKDFKNDDGEPDFIINCKTPYPLEKINSMVLDVFDFNLERFTKKYLKKYDLVSDVDTQTESKPWLIKDKLNELFII